MLGDSGGTAPQPQKRHGTALECTAGTYQPWYNAKSVLENRFGTPDELGICLVRIWYRGPVWPLKRCCTIAGRCFFAAVNFFYRTCHLQLTLYSVNIVL